jgi:hypothetical protein
VRATVRVAQLLVQLVGATMLVLVLGLHFWS